MRRKVVSSLIYTTAIRPHIFSQHFLDTFSSSSATCCIQQSIKGVRPTALQSQPVFPHPSLRMKTPLRNCCLHFSICACHPCAGSVSGPWLLRTVKISYKERSPLARVTLSSLDFKEPSFEGEPQFLGFQGCCENEQGNCCGFTFTILPKKKSCSSC